jgi:glycosyltransferase involved in cell wall biosynthesis
LLTKKFSYDIVSIHDWLSSIAGLIIRNNTKLPIVFHVHSTEELRSLGNGSTIVKTLEHEMAKKADKVITVSYAMKDHLISIGYPSNKIEVVYNGVDPEIFSPKNVKNRIVKTLKEMYGVEDDEKVVFFIGRLTWIKGVVKGVENLIKAFSYVIKEFPETKLIILGKGEQYEHLTNLVNQLGLQEKVRIRSGFLSREEVIAHYALADVCVFPSLAEPFGIVCLEAMAMEKPVVVAARGVSGFREQVICEGENQCGFHINQFDPLDIAWGIKECLKDDERARLLGKNGRKRVIENFHTNNTARKTLEIYESVIAHAKG